MNLVLFILVGKVKLKDDLVKVVMIGEEEF